MLNIVIRNLRPCLVDTNFGWVDLEKMNLRMDIASTKPSRPSNLVRAIKAKSSRLGLGEGRHLLDSHLRRCDRHQKRQQLIASGIHSASSQASIYSSTINQSDHETRSISSSMGPNGPDMPLRTNRESGRSSEVFGDYESDDQGSCSKYSDDFPRRRRKNLYHSGVRGTRALLRVAHLNKGLKMNEHADISSSLHKSPSYLSFRFVVSFVPFETSAAA